MIQLHTTMQQYYQNLNKKNFHISCPIIRKIIDWLIDWLIDLFIYA